MALRLVCFLAVLLMAQSALAIDVSVIDRINYDDFSKFVTVTAIEDADRGTICVSASVTRASGGAATAIDCYQASKPGAFESQNLKLVSHATNIPIGSFAIGDSANKHTCYGQVITRSSGKDGPEGAGAAVSMKCQ